MSKDWKKLKNPPVILAVMEVKFQLDSEIEVHHLKKDDRLLLEKYPIRSENLSGNINLPFPVPGISTAQVSSKKVGFTYINEEKTRKCTVSKENLIFTLEGNYPGWDEFINDGIEIVNHYDYILKESVITRISIRFINNIKIKEISNPTDYFNTSIAAKEGTIEYPIDLYSFRYVMHIPDTNIKVNVIQSLEEKNSNETDVIFDIDVLCHDVKLYKEVNFSEVFEKLRETKNQVFFNNLTEKTLKIL